METMTDLDGLIEMTAKTCLDAMSKHVAEIGCSPIRVNNRDAAIRMLKAAIRVSIESDREYGRNE